jgi:hypothetical protein
MTDEPDGFAEWLKNNPEPSLAELVERWGGFSKVPVEAWKKFDRKMADWKLRYQQHHREGERDER